MEKIRLAVITNPAGKEYKRMFYKDYTQQEIIQEIKQAQQHGFKVELYHDFD